VLCSFLSHIVFRCLDFCDFNSSIRFIISFVTRRRTYVGVCLLGLLVFDIYCFKLSLCVMPNDIPMFSVLYHAEMFVE
jgi:hypothetical protein